MIKTEVLKGLLASLHRHVVYLRSQQEFTLKELTDDFVRWNGVLHLLQLSVQHVTDIGAHLLVGSGVGVPEDYKQIILQMGQSGILTYEFA